MARQKLLGDHVCDLVTFPALAKSLASFQKSLFRRLPMPQRWDAICRQLLLLIQMAPAQTFLLKAVVAFCAQVNALQLLDQPLNLALFECWLNQRSQLSDADQHLIRAKIAGKAILRDDYGMLFPLAGGKRYPGSHFVSAHLAPDVDTTVASFWGWLDAFAARVATAQHLWNLPGGAPDGQIADLLTTLFGAAVFTCLARTSGSMTLSAIDLLTQESVLKVAGETLTSTLDHGIDRRAILYVNKDHYKGDWRGANVEPVKQLTLLLENFLRWFENQVHSQLVLLFAKPKLKKTHVQPLLTALFNRALDQSEPAKALTDRQQELLEALMAKILGLASGLRSTYGDLFKVLEQRSLVAVQTFRKTIAALASSSLFTAQGDLREERSLIFHQLHQIIAALDRAMQAMRAYFDRLDLVMQIKHDVLGYHPHYVTLHSEVEELRSKMDQRDYLTVVWPISGQQLYPLGIVTAASLRRDYLGTVSQRDFSNRQEMRMASYLQVISVIDHHQASLETEGPPQVLIGDVQSSNVLVAEMAFAINDRYSTGGMAPDTIAAQLKRLWQEKTNASTMRLIQSLLKKQMASHGSPSHFIHPQREYAEYLCFLYAVFDDTDLLTKVTKRDVECVVSLLNRMKTLAVGQETEILHLDDLDPRLDFARAAAQRILRHPDVYSIYGKLYAGREQQVEANLKAAARADANTLFSDTKVQNGCCRVGQIKLFVSNFTHFQRIKHKLQAQWIHTAGEGLRVRPEVDLHLLMVSTIASASDVYQGTSQSYAHRDALWIWAAPTQMGWDHLASFLSAFQQSPGITSDKRALSVEFRGSGAPKLKEIFTRHFIPVADSTLVAHAKEGTWALLSFPAGVLNSRKALVSPYLPHLVA